MKEICFDIIMPCYNSENYVRNAIDSLLQQNYGKWNLYAINDGSTDSTVQILNSYAEKDPRIKVFSKKNGGYASAINFGLEIISKNISSDYFLMMGSDDSLAETLFAEIVDAVSTAKELPDIVAFRAVKYKNGVFFERDPISNFESKVTSFDTSAYAFEKQYPQNAKILFIRDTAKCFKTSKLENLRYFGKFGFDADGVFSTLFVHKCHSFFCLPIDGYIWTIRGDSVSASVNAKVNSDRLKVWKKYLSAIRHDKTLILPNQEKKYVLYPFILCVERLNQDVKLPLAESVFLNSALRSSIKTAKEKQVSMSYYEGICDKNLIKRKIFYLLPLMWLKRHGFIKPKNNKT